MHQPVERPIDIGDRVELIAAKLSEKTGLHPYDGSEGVVVAIGSHTQQSSERIITVKITPREDPPASRSGKIWAPEGALKKLTPKKDGGP